MPLFPTFVSWSHHFTLWRLPFLESFGPFGYESHFNLFLVIYCWTCLSQAALYFRTLPDFIFLLFWDEVLVRVLGSFIPSWIQTSKDFNCMYILYELFYISNAFTFMSFALYFNHHYFGNLVI